MHYYHELQQQSAMIEELRDQFFRQMGDPSGVIHYVDSKAEVPLVQQYLQRAGLHSDKSRFFRSSTRFRTQVHKDADGRLCALNIPLTVPKHTGNMRWWDKPEWKSIIHHQDQHVYLRMAYHQEEFVNTPETILDAARRSKAFTKDVPPTVEVKLTRPTLVRVNEWHDITNEGSDVERIVYSIRFLENPTFEELVGRFASIPELSTL